jgi:hypothetical protein
MKLCKDCRLKGKKGIRWFGLSLHSPIGCAGAKSGIADGCELYYKKKGVN